MYLNSKTFGTMPVLSMLVIDGIIPASSSREAANRLPGEDLRVVLNQQGEDIHV